MFDWKQNIPPGRKDRISSICEKLGVLFLATPAVKVFTDGKVDISTSIVVICSFGALFLITAVVFAAEEA
jgi:hypothetical protein